MVLRGVCTLICGRVFGGGVEGCGGVWRGVDLDLDLGANLSAHRTPRVERDGVPDNSAYRPAMPSDAHPGPSTDPPVAPSVFPGRVAMPGCAPRCCWGAPESWPPPGALSLAPAHFLEGLWGRYTGDLRTAAAAAAAVVLQWLRLLSCCHASTFPLLLLRCRRSSRCSAAACGRWLTAAGCVWADKLFIFCKQIWIPHEILTFLRMNT